MSASVVYGLLLQIKGDLRRIKLKDAKSRELLTLDTLQTILKKKTTIQILGHYEYENYHLTMFGYKNGKNGTENKHELPPPLNSDTYYGDILVIASKSGTTWETPINFTPEQYEKFYESVFGESDTESEEDDEEDEYEKEREEEELDVLPTKKKAAEDDGEPEDEELEEDKEDEDDKEDDDEHEEEEDEDEEEDAEEDEEDNEVEDFGEGEGEVECDDEEIVHKKKTSSKKKSSKTNLTVVQNTGRAIQQTLLMRNDIEIIKDTRPIPKDMCNEKHFRENVLEMIETTFKNDFNSEEHIKLENSIFKSALLDAENKDVVKNFDNKLFQICYTSAARKFISNLNVNSYVKNMVLFNKVKNGDLSIENLASMKETDFAQHLYTEIKERQYLREQTQLEGNKAMATDMFKCGRCHKRETTFYELQTRSADEPMTKFINCVNCGNHWRQ